MAKGNKMVLFKVESMVSDRTQFKPYIANLLPENLYVEIPVPDEEVVSQRADKTIITIAGLAVTLDVVATAIEDMHRKSVNKQFGR